MKKIYSFVLLYFFITGCSKDFLDSYDNRVEGTWSLTDVDRRGLGGSISHLPFTDGQFVFSDGGALIYASSTGTTYRGSWDISHRRVSGGCSIDENGNQDCTDRHVRALHITAVDFTTQDVKTEYFDEIVFTGTNKFKAFIYDGAHTYVFHFKR